MYTVRSWNQSCLISNDAQSPTSSPVDVAFSNVCSEQHVDPPAKWPWRDPPSFSSCMTPQTAHLGFTLH